MNTAEYIVKKLEELGVNDFFGVPGDYNFNLIYAVENNPSVNWIGCTNELNAGYAADGYARIKGYGALITTYGAGELSAINAIAGSMAENIPVVHIVGLPSSKSIKNKSLLHHNLQDVNYNAFTDAYKAVTATTALLTKDNAKIEIDKAIKILVKEKKPIYIAVPLDIAEMGISDKDSFNDWHSNENTLIEVSSIIAQKIANAEKPLIVGDALIKRFDATIEYKEFCEKSGIPVSNFLMGKGLIDKNAKNYIGTYCAEFQNSDVEKYFNETDCLITVGAICSDINAFGFNDSLKIKNQIAIYGTHTYIDSTRYDDIKMSDVLEKVTKLIETKEYVIEKSAPILIQKESENIPITSDFLYTKLKSFIKANDIIVGETGTVQYGLAQIDCPSDVNIESQLLWSSTGWATAAALGISIAKPASRVIVISGDGAHLMTGMEIGTIIKNELKPIFIIINNKGYSTERYLSKQPQNNMNDIISINYAKFARIFDGDVWATSVTSEEDFDKALKVTQIMNKLCYIEVKLAEMDIVELAQKFLTKTKDNSNYHKQGVLPKEKNIVLTNYAGSSGYETVVHQAFSEIDKLFKAEDINE